MNFSKYKLQNYLREDATAEENSAIASEKSTNSALEKPNRRLTSKTRDSEQTSQKAVRSRSGVTFNASFDMDDYFKELRGEKEFIKTLESKKVDWRADLQEKAIDGQERENHPYVTVMPTGDENMIQAAKQMTKTVKDKKQAVTENVAIKDPKIEAEAKKAGRLMKREADVRKGLSKKAYSEKLKRNKALDKGDKKTAEERHKKGKKLEGLVRDSYEKTNKYTPVTSTRYNKKGSATEMSKEYEKDKKTGEGRTNIARAVLDPEPRNVKEDIELDEAKKKCKDGYKYDSDKKKCVKKKKKSSSSSKTTVYVGRPIYGGGHHHHHDHHGGDSNGDGGNGGDSGGNGGGGDDSGVSEMIDYLGDLLLAENDAAKNAYNKTVSDLKKQFGDKAIITNIDTQEKPEQQKRQDQRQKSKKGNATSVKRGSTSSGRYRDEPKRGPRSIFGD